jgi:hypothetical protein
MFDEVLAAAFMSDEKLPSESLVVKFLCAIVPSNALPERDITTRARTVLRSEPREGAFVSAGSTLASRRG